MTAFYVLGGVLAAWALIVTALGVTRHDFPRSGMGERGVAAISVILVVAAVAAGIITAASEEEEHGGEPAAAQEAEGPAEEAEAPAEEAPPAEEEPAPAEGGGGEVALAAVPTGELAFDKDSLSAQAGEVTITMENPSPVPHNVALEGGGVSEEGEVVSEGGTSTVSATVEAGEYTFFCSVPGHRQGGMEGTLTVE